MRQFTEESLEKLSTEDLRENLREALIEKKKLIMEQKQLLTRIIYDQEELCADHKILDRIIYKRLIGIRILAIREKRGEKSQPMVSSVAKRDIEDLSESERKKLLLQLLKMREKRQLDKNI